MIGHADAVVADDAHRHAAAEGDLVDLLLHRAGIRIHEDADIGNAVDQDPDLAHQLLLAPRLARKRAAPLPARPLALFR